MMKIQWFLGILLVIALLSSCKKELPTDRNAYHIAKYTNTLPNIDGKADDDCWKFAEWYPIDQLWQGEKPAETDFKGRFKLVWTKDVLIVLAEIIDDTLIDSHYHGLDFYQDDDGLVAFIDEDHSGGNHEYNHNAFAYHIALDKNVVDVSPDKTVIYYNGHVSSDRSCNGNTCIWELAIRIYNDSYNDFSTNRSVQLEAGKRLGFAIAYCDNDHSKKREHFVGSVSIPDADTSRAEKNASVFGTLELIRE